MQVHQQVVIQVSCVLLSRPTKYFRLFGRCTVDCVAPEFIRHCILQPWQ